MLSRNITRFGIQKDAILVSLLFASAAMFGSAVYAEYRYNTAVYDIGEGVHKRIRHTMVGDIKEPFATPTNVCHVATTFTLTVFTYYHGKPLHPGVYVSFGLTLVLAALSWGHHSIGSVTGTWQHNGDKYGMFAVFAWLTCFNGFTLYTTFSPSKNNVLYTIAGCIVFIIGQFAVMYCIVNQRKYDVTTILITLGFTAFTPTVIVSWRQTYTAFRSYRVLKSFVYAVYTTMTPVLLIGLGFMYQLYAEDRKQCDDERCYNDIYNDMFIERRSQYDMFHGVWHYFSALTVALLICLQADQVQGKHLSIIYKKSIVFQHVLLWLTAGVYLVLFFTLNTAKQLRTAILVYNPFLILCLSILLYVRIKDTQKPQTIQPTTAIPDDTSTNGSDSAMIEISTQ
ncbi:hypothetical protein EhV222 [Emiliania huxleyi virus 86]|uniref:Putative membrane protein n=2 Tax=Emiliania huxleyi virus 86 TaxID=181082 RepID=Q4A2R0_EHV8U|nr:hypothetical protein EhV222 [Emiliania huxleyi virus 86]AHA54827.1 putative membrane protein [Emiliania huxleyi virus 145]AHA55849.1 putative membrane protein [Emiliania huxleyi virus 164]CAI65646.1 putative membrane protein [Emiliania huxleyi virus 86]